MDPASVGQSPHVRTQSGSSGSRPAAGGGARGSLWPRPRCARPRGSRVAHYARSRSLVTRRSLRSRLAYSVRDIDANFTGNNGMTQVPRCVCCGRTTASLTPIGAFHYLSGWPSRPARSRLVPQPGTLWNPDSEEVVTLCDGLPVRTAFCEAFRPPGTGL